MQLPEGPSRLRRRPTPTSLSAPGRSRSPRSSSAQASSAIRSASSIGAASVVERLLIEKSEYRSFVVTVRRRQPALPTESSSDGAASSDLGMEERPVGDVSLERLLDRDRARAPSRARGRADRSRARGRAAAGRSCRGGRHVSSVSDERSEVTDRLHARGRKSLLGLRPHTGERTHRERSEEACLLARWDDRDPARLATVGGDLADDLRRRDAERAGERRRSTDGRLYRLGDCTRTRERGHDRAEVEVALVDPHLLDPWHDLTDRVPHRLRVLPVERVTWPHEDDVGAASQGLCRAHRRADAELAGRRSWPSRRRRDPAGCRRRRAAACAVRAPPAPRQRRRMRRGRDGRESAFRERYGAAVITAPPPPPAIEQPAPYPGLVRRRRGDRGARDAARDRARRHADVRRPAAPAAPVSASTWLCRRSRRRCRSSPSTVPDAAAGRPCTTRSRRLRRRPRRACVPRTRRAART